MRAHESAADDAPSAVHHASPQAHTARDEQDALLTVEHVARRPPAEQSPLGVDQLEVDPGDRGRQCHEPVAIGHAGLGFDDGAMGGGDHHGGRDQRPRAKAGGGTRAPDLDGGEDLIARRGPAPNHFGCGGPQLILPADVGRITASEGDTQKGYK